MLDLNRPVKTINISSFNDYIQQSAEPSSVKDKDNLLILYRGQGEDLPLIPVIGRSDFIGSTYSEDKEVKIFNDFKRLSYPFIDSNFKYDDWDWLSLARHHNVPTRLLDWTVNPLIALWFACNKKQKNKSSRVVWRFLIRLDELPDRNSMSPFNLTKTGVFQPNHIAKRITAQNSWFTVHYISDDFKWCDPLENEKQANKNLIKMMIPDDEVLRNEILNRLDIMGINSFSLFPDLEGLGNYLKWKYSSR